MTLEESREAIARFRQEYAAFLAKYPGLPAAEALDAEFDIFEHIGRERLYPRNALRYCRWAMMQAIGSWMGYLHGFILPNPQQATSMEEYNFLDEREKRTVVEVLNWHMWRLRESNLLQLNEDDAKTAALVAIVFKEWLQHKAAVQQILEKATGAWKARYEQH